MTQTPDPQTPTAASIRPHVIRGSLWMVFMRWSMRSLGLVSTIILARLLSPADFGLVAMALLIVGLIEIFGETGQQIALIRLPNPTRDHFDSAWTAQILVSLLLGTAVLLAAPLGALYFDEPRVTPLMQVLSIRVYAIGFENIGVVKFRKELDFARDFRYGVYKKVIAVAVAIPLAFALRNYWALVWGTVVGQLATVVLSYLVHPYRPRLCIRQLREIWSCSIWMLASSVGGYVNGKTAQYVVATIGAPQVLGHFTVGGELAAAPAGELIYPISRALVPNYAKLRHDPRQLLDTYLDVVSAVTIVAASTSAGMAVVAGDLVPVLLGPQWSDSVPFVVWLAIASGIGACSSTALFLLQAVADPRRVAAQSWTRLAVMGPVLVGAAHFGGVEAVAPAYLVATVLLIPTFLYNLRAAIPITIGQLACVTWRPILAAAAMATAVAGLSAGLSNQSALVRLLLEVPGGVVVFGAALYLLWFLAGAPHGAERAGLRYLLGRLRKLGPAIEGAKGA